MQNPGPDGGCVRPGAFFFLWGLLSLEAPLLLLAAAPLLSLSSFFLGSQSKRSSSLVPLLVGDALHTSQYWQGEHPGVPASLFAGSCRNVSILRESSSTAGVKELKTLQLLRSLR